MGLKDKKGTEKLMGNKQYIISKHKPASPYKWIITEASLADLKEKPMIKFWLEFSKPLCMPLSKKKTVKITQSLKS